MICPKCYGKMDGKTGVCKSCGFSVHDLIGATNAKAKKALKSGKKDDVMYTSKLPNDISRKKLLLFGGFLGLFGAHNFYVGKMARGVYQAVAFSLLVIFLVLNAIFPYTYWIQQIETVTLLFSGIGTLIWIFDFLAICFGNYKVPVYKEEYSFKKDIKVVSKK